jgi:pimeloyl-ACP methyl ester carboxylesterase
MSATTTTLSSRQDTAIRPFRAEVPQADLDDLRRRIAATRWPDAETVADRSQGARLAELQELVRHWGTDYDWRAAEARLNAFPQYRTTIDGVDVHFIHVRSRHPGAMPLIISHGWPGSVFEQLKVIEPLTDPTAFGGRAEDAFDVVIPSLPGFGFSSRPTEVGWGLERIGRAWDVLMKRLGYRHYVAQGGDWGGGLVEVMARQAPDGLLAIHTNLPAVFPRAAADAIDAGGPAPAGLSDGERAEFEALSGFLANGGWAYLTMMSARPQAVGYGLADSPAGLAGFMLVHGGFEEWSYGKDPAQSPTRDEVLDDLSLYWLTNTAVSAARLYWENRDENLISAAAQRTDEIEIPVAITAFPDDDLYRAPESWARQAFPTLVYFNTAAAGGHFAAWEQPQLFSEEVRAAFRSLRRPATGHTGREDALTTTCQAYTSTRDAERAIERLVASGVPESAVELIMGHALEDARDAPIGTFAGTTTADAETVGSFAGAEHSGREAAGTFAGDPGKQRRGAFGDVDRDTVTRGRAGVRRTRVASHRHLAKLLVGAGLDPAAAAANVAALHEGRVLVLVHGASAPGVVAA